jgi:uncharacterized membrane protein YtjA (UPF0391 family)
LDSGAWNKPEAGLAVAEWSDATPAAGTIAEGSKLDQRFRGPPAPADDVEESMTILKWALIFFLVSVVAGILGFTGVSAASADIARFLFYVFVVIFLVLLILGLTIFRV